MKNQILKENDLKNILPELENELQKMKLQKEKSELRNKNDFTFELKNNLKILRKTA